MAATTGTGAMVSEGMIEGTAAMAISTRMGQFRVTSWRCLAGKAAAGAGRTVDARARERGSGKADRSRGG